MSTNTTNVYVPGVCNIGPAEIRMRRTAGVIGLVITALFVAAAVIFGIPTPWRLLVVIPAGLGASGFLQAALHFCARFGMSGLFNLGDELGRQEQVYETEYRRADQRKAVTIVIGSVLIAIVVAGIAMLLP
ncbi:hypothetical protein [Compostimonas suwonensis]|nr:hypothetical protein [Compostimonas suwonensis]